MEKVKAFFIVLVLASVSSFVLAFLLGLLVGVFYAPYTIETAFSCGVGIALGCGPMNAIFAAIRA
jgi:VIT1/CCC1 family predicted Fe2+/Mn2+ transporter